MKSISIIIPLYNEEETAAELVKKVLSLKLPLEKQILAVDDGSTDSTYEIIEQVSKTHPEVTILKHRKNAGKGAALQTAFSHTRGDIVIIQDGDLEYDPAEIPKVIKPLVEGKADLVYGSRFLKNPRRNFLFFFYLGNKLLTYISNIFTSFKTTDMETCYKAFKKELIENMELKEKRFGVEPELTAKFSKKRPRFAEIPIKYKGRAKKEGKKIKWKDGIKAIYCIIKYNIFS